MTGIIDDMVNVDKFASEDMLTPELAVLNRTELAMLIEQEPELKAVLTLLNEQKECDLIASQTSCEQRELYHFLMGPG